MRIAEDYPEFEKFLVFLDGAYCRGVLAADDEEGWVEVMDFQSLVFPTLPACLKDFDEPGEEGKVEEWKEMDVIRKTGKVTFKKLP